MARAPSSTIRLLRILVSLALVAAIVAKVGPGRILHAARDADPALLGLALALGVPRFAAKIVRWRLLARRAVPSTGWPLAASSLLVGTAGAVITPGRVGQAASSLLFPPGNRLVLSGMALTDPLADLAIAVLLVAFQVGGPWAGTAVLAGFGFAAHAAPRIGAFLAAKGGKVRVLGEALERLDGRTLAKVAVLSAVIYGFNLVQFHFLLTAHGPAPFAAAARSLPLIFLAVACPITISGFGLREATAALALARYGIEAGIAVQASFELFLINLLLPGLIGALLAGRLGIRLRPRLATASEESPKPGDRAPADHAQPGSFG
ncbi:flippase-like domain-containing protein [Candidatus Fermentibacteria bacterium]|nr:flippase-like domain-containing protein [Candidatus Fermentibacteria bacterium]